MDIKSSEISENKNILNSANEEKSGHQKHLACIPVKKPRSKKIVANDLDSNVCLNLNPSQSPAENRTYIADSYEIPAEPLPPQEYESAQIESEIILTMSKSEDDDTNQDSDSNWKCGTYILEGLTKSEPHPSHPVESLAETAHEIHNTAFVNATEDDSAIDNSLRSKTPNVPEPTKEMIVQEETEFHSKHSPNSCATHSVKNKSAGDHIDDDYSENIENEEDKGEVEIRVSEDKHINGDNCKHFTKNIFDKIVIQTNLSTHNHIGDENCPNDFIKDEREVETKMCTDNDIQSKNLDNYDIGDDNNMNILKDNNIEGKNCEIDNIRGKGEAEANISAPNCIASDNGDMKNDTGSVETALCTDNHIDKENSQNHDMHDEQGGAETNAPTDNQMDSENSDSKDYKNGGETNTYASKKSEIKDNKEDSNQYGAGLVGFMAECFPGSDSVPMESWEPQGFTNPRGYYNLNSVVQALVSCEEFRKAMMSYEPDPHNNHKDLTFVLGLCNLIRGLKNKDKDQVHDALRTIQSHCGESALGDGFFKCFMNILSRINGVIENNSQQITIPLGENIDKGEINFRKQKNKNQGFIFDNFYGQLVFQTVCKRCNYVVNESFQVMKSLPLPIPSSSGTVTLDMCIEEFFKESDIDSDIPMSCQCDSGCSIDLELRTRLTHTPRYLFIYLNRGSYNRERKNETNVECELFLIIKTVRGEKFVYDLISVIDHVGTNEFGHYYCKCCYDGETWWCLNDSNVQRMTSSSGVVCRDSIGFIFKKHESHP